VFESFFPKPKLFFSSAAAWSLAAVLIWYGFAESLGAKLGFGATPEGQEPVIGLGHFVTPEALWFYVYYAICTFIFGGFLVDLFEKPSLAALVDLGHFSSCFYNLLWCSSFGGDQQLVSPILRCHTACAQ
jgi:ABC-type long-subunit fatty acid transport system fused permease/ATPase subunit